MGEVSLVFGFVSNGNGYLFLCVLIGWNSKVQTRRY